MNHDIDATTKRPESAARSLITELLARVDREPIEIPVPDKPAWSLRIRPQIDDAALKRINKAAADRDGNVEPLAMARLLIAETCIAILHDGEPRLDETGAPLTFASDELRSGAGLRKTSDAELVSVVFGNPVHVMRAGEAISRALEEASPSSTSSSRT